MRNVKSTNTTLFLLPGLGLNEDEMGANLGFIDAFMVDPLHPVSFRYPVYVLFKPIDVREFQQFVEGEQKRTAALEEDYDYEGGFVVLLYRFPANFENDYKRFVKGRYSKFSIKYFECLPRFDKATDGSNPNIPQLSLQRMAFHRSPALRDLVEELVGEPIGDECWSKPSIERETLKIDRIRRKYL